MFALIASVPHPDAQLGPVRLQFTNRLGFPEPVTCALNDCVAPVATVAPDGETVTWTLLSSVMLAVPLAEGWAWLAAVIVMPGDVGRTEGAV